MTCWAIVPVKAPGEGKQRLSGALDPAQRDMIVRAMLARVVAAIRGVKGIDRLVLVGPSRLGADPAIPLLAEPGGGLNPAVSAGFAHAADQGAHRVIVLHADLPDLTAQDCEALASPPAGAIARPRAPPASVTSNSPSDRTALHGIGPKRPGWACRSSNSTGPAWPATSTSRTIWPEWKA